MSPEEREILLRLIRAVADLSVYALDVQRYRGLGLERELAELDMKLRAEEISQALSKVRDG